MVILWDCFWWEFSLWGDNGKEGQKDTVPAWSYNDVEFYSSECELGLLVTGNDLEFRSSWA
jgi:hypothetical protein